MNLERAFRRRRLDLLQKVLIERNIVVVTAFFVVLIAFAGVFAVEPDIATDLRLLGVFGLSATTVVIQMLRRDLRVAAVATQMLEMATLLFFAWLVRHDLGYGTSEATTSILAFSSTIIYMVSMAPGGMERSAAHAALSLGGALWAVWPWLDETVPFLVVTLGSVVAALAFKILIRRQFAAQGLVELGLLQATAPRSVILQVAASDRPVHEIFSARPRRCVCVSSDWRGYQQLSMALTPAELTAALEAYYEQCERLLAEAAPEGDYYFDWIADELFVVFFDLSEADGRDLAGRALGFADALVVAKAQFLATHAGPAGIDVGIGAGTALVGMLGAPGMSKVTAAGPMQAKVRQLQGEAKALRAQLGACDRIVLGSELRAAAPGALPVPGREGLYYLEPLKAIGAGAGRRSA